MQGRNHGKTLGETEQMGGRSLPPLVEIGDHPFKTSAFLVGGGGSPMCRCLPMLGGEGF